MTTGESKFEGIVKLKSAGLNVTDIVVLIDRQSGAKNALSKAGYRMHTVFTLTELLDYWGQTEQVPNDIIREVRTFLS